MVFSSFNFFFLFLPVTLVGFFILGRRDGHWAASWLLLASLAFYVSWNLAYLPILAISIVGNYLAYRGILQAAEARKKAWLILAVTGNLLLLGYFKYANFFIQSVNDLTGAGIGKCQGSCRFGHAAPRSRKTASRWSSPAGTGEAGGGRQRSVDRSVVSVSGVLGR